MTEHSKAYLGTYQGEKAIWLKFDQYEAAVLPEIGANLIAFRDSEKEFQYIHEPAIDEMASFKARPMIHGIPVLFPPNRYEDGKFPWEGKEHQFPLNEPRTGNHLHGFLYNIPWTVEAFSSDESESRATFVQKVDEHHDMYGYFPYCFTMVLHYALSKRGLHQRVTIINDGDVRMPCLFAFHTSINAPFAPNSKAEDYKVKITIGERWELNERMLPTGKLLPLSSNEQLLQGDGIFPFFEALDHHFTVQTQAGRNRMELTDTRNDVKLVYDVGASYKQWMIYNNNAKAGFFCPEPQVNLVNATNVDLPSDEIGLFGLMPQEIWEETSRLYVIG